MFSAVIQVFLCFVLLVRCQTTADSFIELPSLPTPRTFLMSATVNSDIYVFGGVQEGKSNYALSTVEKFSPSKNSTWTTLSAMPVALHSGSATFYNDVIYIIGGFTNGWTLTNSSFRYNHALDTWTQIAPMPTSRGGLSSVWVNNKLYAIGGYDGKNFLKTVEIYDPTTNSWTTGPSLNYPRERFVAGAINKKIYAVAGRGPSNMDVVESLDPAASSPQWEILDSRINTNRSSFGGVTYGNRILIFGGENGNAVNVVEDLLVDTMEWRCRKNMPTARQGFSATVASTLVYLIGGGTGTGLSSSNINQAYFPAENSEPSTCQKSTQLIAPTSSSERLSVFVYMLALMLIIAMYM